MSKITLAPNAAGTGTLTIAAPNTSTDYTLTLPTATTTLVGTDATQTLTNKSIAGSQLTGTVASSLLTGALPAIDGSALTGIPVGTGLTLLGTIATTSGSSVTLSGLTLTPYKQLQFFFENVSGSTASSYLRLNGWNVAQPNINAVGDYSTGGGIIDLATGIFFASSNSVWASNPNGSVGGQGGSSGLTTASTSITFTISTGAFDAGSIKIYGVK